MSSIQLLCKNTELKHSVTVTTTVAAAAATTSVTINIIIVIDDIYTVQDYSDTDVHYNSNYLSVPIQF